MAVLLENLARDIWSGESVDRARVYLEELKNDPIPHLIDECLRSSRSEHGHFEIVGKSEARNLISPHAR